ncbi:MAG: aspartate aminotransferase family protein [Ruminococcaceae bacterium]|nr:aspartate aminotransferase family protein [Oscillospiraceae bacterium]
MNLENIIEYDKKYYMNTFGDRLPVAFTKGKGIKLYSTEGEVYYDFMGGIAVSSLGHGYKPLVKAIAAQAKNVIHTSSLYYIENQAKLAMLLCENSCFDKAFFCNSGAEANEGAIKLARKYFYKKGEEKSEIITLKNSFHGRTVTTISATGQEKYQKPYAPLTEKFIHVEINNFDELTANVTDKTGAIILELVQGESGVHPLDSEYIKKVRKLCDERDILLIFDEVQTGMGRLGTLFGYQTYMVEPDILTLAKGLGGGVPIGAVLAKDKFCAFEPGDHGTTFGGNPLATGAGCVVIDELVNKKIIKKSKATSDYFFKKLNKLKKKHEIIKEVRGLGLMIGIEFNEAVGKAVFKKLFEKKFLIGSVGETTLRLLPPLIVTKKEVDLFIKTFTEILEEL